MQVFYSFNRLGHIMKRLTAVTVIIMVPNFVASIYGMNFEHLFPPSEWKYGFLLVVGIAGLHGGVGLHPLEAAALAVATRGMMGPGCAQRRTG